MCFQLKVIMSLFKHKATAHLIELQKCDRDKQWTLRKMTPIDLQDTGLSQNFNLLKKKQYLQSAI